MNTKTQPIVQPDFQCLNFEFEVPSSIPSRKYPDEGYPKITLYTIGSDFENKLFFQLLYLRNMFDFINNFLG